MMSTSLGSLLVFFLQHALFVSTQDCTNEGMVRLADSTSANEGRVEVCMDGEWGTICDHNWGPADARVVCRLLGKPFNYADALYRYGGGSGPIHFAGFHCSGNESSLLNCPVNRAGSALITNCGHHEDAGVRCSNVPCAESDVRLNEEVVQVCHDREWGLLCADGGSWGQNAAHVMCNEAGTPSANPRSASRRVIFYDAPIILNMLTCTGSEESIIDCSNSGFGLFPQCSTIAVAQCEVRKQCDEENSIRLTEFSDDTIGRLEVCTDGIWGSVCGNGATGDIATVVCKELNHTSTGRISQERNLNFLLSLVPLTLTNMMCNGNESTISQCSFDRYDGDPQCSHRNDLIIECLEVQECSENDVRLVGGRTPNDGQVEVCLNGVWGSVCDDRWDSRDAEVVCRQLQYNGPSYPILSYHTPTATQRIHLDDVQCLGNEERLSDCIHQGIGVENCLEGQEEAGVICSNVTCDHGTVHLVGGNDDTRGRVEYCHEGTWYSVCADGWQDSQLEARVICNSLGYSRLAFALVSYGRGRNPILPLQFQCDISNSALSDCSTTDAGQCTQVAGIECVAICTTVGITNCSLCSSRELCQVVSAENTPICNCHSDCYRHGDCCSDISQVDNCVVRECETGELRLVGGTTNFTGVLEVCGDGVWGKVCNRLGYWGPDNTRVVCRQLGLLNNGGYILNDLTPYESSDRIHIVGEVHCIGTETELMECSHSSFGHHFCGPDQSLVPDIAISCLSFTCSSAGLSEQIIDCVGMVPETRLVCSFDNGPFHPCTLPLVFTIRVSPPGAHSVRILSSTGGEQIVPYTITKVDTDVPAKVPPLEINLLNGSPRIYEDAVEAQFITTRPVTGVRCFLRSYTNRFYKDCSNGTISFSNLGYGFNVLKIHAYNRGGDMATVKNAFFITKI